MIGAAAGVLAGILQYILLRAISARITGLKNGAVFPFFLAKLALYGVIITLVLTVFRDTVLYAGCGYAAGMGIGVLCAMVSGFRHRENSTASAAPSPSDTNKKTEGE